MKHSTIIFPVVMVHVVNDCQYNAISILCTSLARDYIDTSTSITERGSLRLALDLTINSDKF